MPLLTLIGIIIGMIQLVFRILDYLDDHPNVTPEIRAKLSEVKVAMTRASERAADISTRIEAP